MRTNRTDHSAHSDPIRQHLSLASALGVGLAACLSGPARAEIIDDFEQGYRFWANHGGGDSRIEIIDGQLHFNAAADWGRVTAGYLRNHALPEGEPLTFAVDVISLSPTSLSAAKRKWRRTGGLKFLLLAVGSSSAIHA